MYIVSRVDPNIVIENHEMDMRASRSAGAAFIADYLALCHILTYTNDEPLEVPVNSSGIGNNKKGSKDEHDEEFCRKRR